MKLMEKINLKTGQVLTVNDAENKDAEKLIEYVKQVVDETNFLTFTSAEFKHTVQDEEKFIEKMNSLPNNKLLLAKIENEIVGIVTIAASQRERIKHNGELAISIKKEYWNFGIGSALMKNIIDWAIQNNDISKINLSVSDKNENAIKLYKKFKFEIEGERLNFFKIKGTYVNAYLMGLIL